MFQEMKQTILYYIVPELIISADENPISRIIAVLAWALPIIN